LGYLFGTAALGLMAALLGGALALPLL